MAKPVVAIVGRPNVGKSTLFNRIAGRRIAIIEDTPGVTRDRIYADCEWITKHFSLIDTGGIEPDSDDIILSQMRTQAELAIDTADVILFIVDGKNGMTATDREIGDMLRKSKKKVILVCNKIDKFVDENNIYEFYELGFEEVVSISASEGLGIGDLLDDIISKFGEAPEEEIDEDEIRIAVIGKPNAGKSSIINKMIGEGRVIVSNIPGTTRDSIDTNFEKDNQKYVLIDTAGIRRKSKVNENIERYSVIRALRSIERADICLLIIDAENGVTEQDTKISGYAHENGKAIIIVINKWDLVEKDNKTHKDYLEDVVKKLSFITYAPVLTVSALTGQRVHSIFKTVNEVSDYSKFRISTGVLNDIIAEAVLMNQPRSVKGKRLKILYALQASVKPPKFIIFVNNKDLVHFSYKRYLENKIRESFIFKGTPIVLEFRNRGS